MIKSIYLGFVLVILAITTSCKNDTALFVSYTNPQIEYSGRIDTSQIEAAELYWSASSIKITFEGKSVSALLRDNRGDNYYNVIVDGESPFVLRPDTLQKYYKLAEALKEGKHTLEIFKRTEWDRGKTEFYGFEIGGGGKLLPKPEAKQRKIEFYGNSITAGYAVEDTSGKDRPDSTFTNCYLSYATLTAKHFNAQYHLSCKSGIGILISWFPMIMPEIYDRLNPEDSNSHWDFSRFTPDLVVINLLQNDSWLVNLPEREEFKTNFGTKAPTDIEIISAYKNFVSSIREHYPEASIICMLGNMDATREGSIWPVYIEQAVNELNDTKIYTHFVKFKDSPGHPTIKEQEDMAKSLIQFIDEKVVW